MKYVVYDPDVGTILQWGDGEPPVGSTYLEHSIEGSLADYCVSAGVVATKPVMTLTWDATAPADGETLAVISGIPADTRVTCVVSGSRFYETVQDGTAEIATVDPQTVTVRFWHPVYQHDAIEVVFV